MACSSLAPCLSSALPLKFLEYFETSAYLATDVVIKDITEHGAFPHAISRDRSANADERQAQWIWGQCDSKNCFVHRAPSCGVKLSRPSGLHYQKRSQRTFICFTHPLSPPWSFRLSPNKMIVNIAFKSEDGKNYTCSRSKAKKKGGNLKEELGQP